MTSHIGVQRLLHYDRRDLRGDLMGGVTVTAYLIPQVMAYSALAGLAPQAGLAVIVVAMVLYAMVGSSRLLSVGPESTTALMTAAVLAPLAAGDPVRYAALAAMLAMLVGLYALLSGVLRLGFIGDLLSRPVLIGYMAGVAVIMISSQLGKVTGVDVAGDSFVEDIGSFAGNTLRDGVSWPTLAIGAAVAGLLLFFTPRYPKVPVPLVVMLLATAVVAVFDLTAQGVTTVGDVSFDGMNVGLPSLDTIRAGHPAASGARHLRRRLHRQHPHRAGLRHPQSHPGAQQPGVPGHGDRERRLLARRRVPGQLERQPHVHRRGQRCALAALLAGGGGADHHRRRRVQLGHRRLPLGRTRRCRRSTPRSG